MSSEPAGGHNDTPDLDPIEICAPQRGGYLILRCREISGPQFPSLNFSASVTKPGFTGSNPSIWLEGRVLSAFVEGLAALDRTRQGEAVLDASYSGELHLRIRSEDSAGHLLVSVKVSRHSYIGFQSTRALDVTTLHFELDPSDLSGLLAAFRQWEVALKAAEEA